MRTAIAAGHCSVTIAQVPAPPDRPYRMHLTMRIGQYVVTFHVVISNETISYATIYYVAEYYM